MPDADADEDQPGGPDEELPARPAEDAGRGLLLRLRSWTGRSPVAKRIASTASGDVDDRLDQRVAGLPERLRPRPCPRPTSRCASAAPRRPARRPARSARRRCIHSSGLPTGDSASGGHRAGLVGRLAAAAEPGQLQGQPGDEQVHDAVGDQPDPGEVLEGVAVRRPARAVVPGRSRATPSTAGRTAAQRRTRRRSRRLRKRLAPVRDTGRVANGGTGILTAARRLPRSPGGPGRSGWPSARDDRRRRRRRPVGRRRRAAAARRARRCSSSSAARLLLRGARTAPSTARWPPGPASLGTAALAGGAVALVVAVASAGLAAGVLLVGVPVLLLVAAGGSAGPRRSYRPSWRAGAAGLVGAGHRRCSSSPASCRAGTGRPTSPPSSARWPSPSSGCRCSSPPSDLRTVAAAARAGGRPAGCAGCACGAGGCGS